MKNLKITAKLMVGFGAVLIMLVIIGMSSFLNNASLDRTVKDYSTRVVPNTERIWQVRRNLVAVQRDLLLALSSTDQAVVKGAVDSCMENRKLLGDTFAELKSISRIDQSLFKKFDDQLTALAPIREKIVELVLVNSDESNAEAYNLYITEYGPGFDVAAKTLVEITDAQHKINATRDTDAAKTYYNAKVLNFFVIITALIITLIMIWLITKSIVNPVKEIEAAAKEMADGKLGAKIKYTSKDELGSLANSMRESMQTISGYIQAIDRAMGLLVQGNFAFESSGKFKGDFASIQDSIWKFIHAMSDTLLQIKTAADQVSSGSEQVSSGAQSLAQGATEQASAVEQLSASISEISSQVKLNAENSSNANNRAENATNAIVSSNSQMQNLMTAMDNINSKSAEISKIIKTIEDIAFQTNILALNAAVEAARAGSAGKGFAVVADEVRNLAGKSAEAAKNTTSLIEDSVTSISEGVKLAEATAKDLVGAVDSVKHTTEIISNITKASGEQAASISQVSIGVDQISAVVQTNSATSEESAAASQELSSQASLLNELVSKFTLASNN